MAISNHVRDILIALAIGIVLFFINKILALVVAIAFFVYLNHKNHIRNKHEEFELIYDGGGH